ncbi:hypothetical protein CDD81_6096 [Ophiocordyceps australis]|uniref:Uncharacterized protein n=1 Tax=Ophiocordyceps australis TaxID=1399860 RepID=A0A2C5Y7U2_9HYPO|nr:hypothetical protein CDD81_6096 [Ophiocordyceps australis]
MAPVRRYLRITKHSALECRIYLDNPALVHSWLLHPRHAVLPRVMESIRPLVLPKLREEKERSKKRSTRKKGIKDVVVQDDFEVSVFLTETNTRHSLLVKHKEFHDKAHSRLQSNSTRMLDEANRVQINIEPESDDENCRLADIPAAEPPRRSKRRRNAGIDEAGEPSDERQVIQVDSDDEPAPKRTRGTSNSKSDDDADDDDEDKKKLAMDISYQGFSIYGRVLCLVVKRRDAKVQPAGARTKAPKPSCQGQAAMENWISSTQKSPDEE